MTERSTPDLTDIAERVAGLLADGEVSAVVTHLAGFTAAYRLSHPIELIAEHMRAGRLPLGPGDMRLIARSGPVSTRLILTGTDRAGLLTAVSGVLALERLSIIDARFATRSDGRVFDTFDVVDALEGGAAPEARLRSTEETLSRVLRGSFDLESALAVKQRDYRNLARPGVEPVVNISRTPGGGGVVEVEAADRLGLLHDLGRVFQGFSMAVVRARIDTRAGVAYDAFTVTRLPADVDRLRVSLEDALRRTPNPTAPM